MTEIGRDRDLFTKPSGGILTVINKYGQIFIDEMKKRLVENDSVATRKLLQSVRFKVRIVGEIYHFEIRMEDYWKYVEDGRKAGKMPPVDSIVRWITQKGINVGPLGKKNKPSRDKKRRNLAFLIARKIQKKGIKPRPFQSKVITKQFLSKFQADLSKAAKTLIEVEIKQIKEDLQ